MTAVGDRMEGVPGAKERGNSDSKVPSDVVLSPRRRPRVEETQTRAD